MIGSGGYPTIEDKEQGQEERRLLAGLVMPGEESSGRIRDADLPTLGTASLGDKFAQWTYGVFPDGQRVAFDADWVFPDGTNHQTSVEVMANGAIPPDGFAAEPIAAVWKNAPGIYKNGSSYESVGNAFDA